MIKLRITSKQPNINEYENWIERDEHNPSVNISNAKQFDCLRSLFNIVHIIATINMLNNAKINKFLYVIKMNSIKYYLLAIR